MSLCVFHLGLGRGAENLGGGVLAHERRLRETGSPWLCGHAAEGYAGGADGGAGQLEPDGRRGEGELERGAVADLQIRRVPRMRGVGNEDGGDQLAVLQVVLMLRRIAGQEVKLRGVDFPLAL